MQKSLRLPIKGGAWARVKQFTTFEASTDFRRFPVSLTLVNCASSFVACMFGDPFRFSDPPPQHLVASSTWRAWRTLAMKLAVAALASSKLRLGCVLARFLCFGSGTTPCSHDWQGTASAAPVEGSTACSKLRMTGIGRAAWSVAATLRGQRL
jgi:hypothetical protein